MVAFNKMFKTELVAALFVVGLAGGAGAQVAAGSGLSSFNGGSRGALQITGKVLCVGCTLEEVRKAQPEQRHLYQFSHRRGRVVLEVTAVNDDSRWNVIAWPPQLWVRAEDSLFQKLSAEENWFKEIEITGLLNNSRTLDVFDVAVRG